MDSEKNMLKKSGRWLRVGVLALTTFGPLVNMLAVRLLQRLKDDTLADTHIQVVAPTSQSESGVPQAKLQALGAVLSDVLDELKSNPSNQNVLKHAEKLVRSLKKQGFQISYVATERGSQLSQDWSRRGEQIREELSQRSNQLSQQLNRRSDQAKQSLAEQDTRFWIASGFGLGLVLAGLLTFQLIRQRMQHKAAEVAGEPPILLPYHGPRPGERVTGPIANNQSNGQMHTTVATPTTPATPQATTPSPLTQSSGRVTEGFRPVGNKPLARSVPTDAAFIGLVGSKLYYPIETPLERLTTSGQTTDVVYFSSEQEARVQGFSAAQA